jgi:hypothetical protein
MVGLVAAGRVGAEDGVAGAGRVGAGGAEAAGATGAGVGGAAGAEGGRGAGAPAAGDGAVGLGLRTGAAAAGCSEAGRLVIRRLPARLAGVGAEAAGAAAAESASAAAGRGEGAAVRSGAVASARAGSATLSLVCLTTAAFLASGSSGCTGRLSPSRSAFRRARSAWASSMDDEWLFTPIPRDRQRSSASLLVNPSS